MAEILYKRGEDEFGDGIKRERSWPRLLLLVDGGVVPNSRQFCRSHAWELETGLGIWTEPTPPSQTAFLVPTPAHGKIVWGRRVCRGVSYCVLDRAGESMDPSMSPAGRNRPAKLAVGGSSVGRHPTAIDFLASPHDAGMRWCPSADSGPLRSSD
ncbi:hypothetical protein PCL_12773 [Purpureocillium lilacinum]|uniref:Uncharacterized protein n=1 Tax=Purpureocillium lilacinum TaxID=33203 RepID=A0A2U3E7C7_PURLI|nr:hypothetical protein Purlil1_7925 [Purpureocillium lilacinum]PWI70374.1 hypothetical protein PCL_12773 [Purpureocillium lilacinum]